jgi:hypothetical protein
VLVVILLSLPEESPFKLCKFVGSNLKTGMRSRTVSQKLSIIRVALLAAQRKTFWPSYRRKKSLCRCGFTGARRSPFTYVSYFTIMYVSKTLLLLAVGAAVIN